MPFISIDETLSVLQLGGMLVQNPDGNVWVVKKVGKKEFRRIGGLSRYTFRFFDRYGVIREVPKEQRVGRGNIEYVLARRDVKSDG